MYLVIIYLIKICSRFIQIVKNNKVIIKVSNIFWSKADEGKFF